MSTIIFVTGNVNKLNEAKGILGNKYNIINKKVDLPEIQSVDVEEVVKEKIKEAYKILKSPCFVEDTGLYIKKLNGFPGALIKFYYEYLNNTGICKQTGGSKAYVETIIGYYNGKKIIILKGILNGTISKKPKGNKGFGWDPIFIPNGKKKTLAELDFKEKNKISARYKAFLKLKKILK